MTNTENSANSADTADTPDNTDTADNTSTAGTADTASTADTADNANTARVAGSSNETKRLTQWVINKIKNEFPDDIALLVAVDGASVNGDGHGEPFDYFVPATERGNELARTFIIGGVGNDLYPRSWERCERTANLEDWASFCLGNAKILYSHAPEDEARFMAIRQKLFDNLNNPAFVYKKALKQLEYAMDMYRTMLFEDRLYKARGLAGFIHYYLAMGVAYLNNTYVGDSGYHRGALAMYSKWSKQPKLFLEYYEAILVARTISELRSVIHVLIISVREFIAGFRPKQDSVASPDYQGLADWYQELRTTLNRIYYYCGIGNIDAAFRDACGLQNELSVICEEFDFFNSFRVEEKYGFSELDLLGAYDARDLGPLAKRAAQIEEIIISALRERNITINQYDTLDDFLADNA